jgi:hypothetical protein
MMKVGLEVSFKGLRKLIRLDHDALSEIKAEDDAVRHEYLQHRSQLFTSHLEHYFLSARLLKSLTVEIRDDDNESGRVHLHRFAGQIESLNLLVIDRDDNWVYDYHGTLTPKRKGTDDWGSLRFPKLDILTKSTTSNLLYHFGVITQEEVLPVLRDLTLISNADYGESGDYLSEQMAEMRSLQGLTVIGQDAGISTVLENLHVIPNLQYLDLEIKWDIFESGLSEIERSISLCKSLKEQNVDFIPIGQENEKDYGYLEEDYPQEDYTPEDYP